MTTTEQLQRAVHSNREAFNTVNVHIQRVERDRTEARLRLAEVQAEVAQLDREHGRFGTLKNQLLKELVLSRALYQRHIMARFPEELLRDIFIHCSNDASRDWYDDTKWTSNYTTPIQVITKWIIMPYRLTTVCQKWRTVALETGCLWAYVATDTRPGENDDEVMQSQLLRAATSFLRSKSAPLHVHLPWQWVKLHDYRTSRSVNLAHKLLTDIQRSAYRLDRVSLGIVPQFTDTMYSIFKAPTPTLSFLFMQESWVSEQDPEESIFTAGLPYAPNLRSMELYGSGRLEAALQCESLNSLGSLRLWTADTSSVECYVPRCSSLRHLTLSVNKGEHYGGLRLDLQHLQVLSLTGSMFFASEADPEPRIVAPRLESLILDELDVTPGHRRLLQSLNPSQLALRYMEREWILNLSCLKNVRRLVFGGQRTQGDAAPVIEDAIFELLCDTSPPIWPKLEEIVIEGGGEQTEIEPEDAPELLRMAAMRGPRRLSGRGADNEVTVATLVKIELNHDPPAYLQSEIERLLTPIAS